MKKLQKALYYIILVLLGVSQSSTATNLSSNSFEDNSDTSTVVIYNYPRICPQSTEYKVRVNNKEVFVYNTSADPFASFACDGPVTIEVEMPNPTKNVTVSPVSKGIKTTINGNLVTFVLPKPMPIAIEVNGFPELYIFASAIDTNPPLASDKNVKYFKTGQIYEVGELTLGDNETLYIEGGAVVRGCVRATNAKNIRIAGSGVLDGGYYRRGVDDRKSILLKECKDAIIEDIIMIEPSTWMIVLGNCENITVQNVRQLGSVGTSDGVDIVGSKKIKVIDSFLRNGDDCIAIKAKDLGKDGNFCQDVEDIEIRGCAMISYTGGSALEIGHELRTNSISNIRFIDCDILGVHGFGSVFGIHNTDRAHISNVLYENVRVEHYYDKLIDMRIIKSRYFRDEERGSASDIVFKDVKITVSTSNPGYSSSIMGGYDAKHKIKNVTFDNVTLNGVKVLNANQLDLFTKEVSNIKFK